MGKAESCALPEPSLRGLQQGLKRRSPAQAPKPSPRTVSDQACAACDLFRLAAETLMLHTAAAPTQGCNQGTVLTHTQVSELHEHGQL